MCTEVEIRGSDGAILCKSKGELSKSLGGQPVSVGGDDEEWADHICLCPLDIDATAEKYGFNWRMDDGVVVFERPHSADGSNTK